jgi:hypothetical protein
MGLWSRRQTGLGLTVACRTRRIAHVDTHVSRRRLVGRAVETGNLIECKPETTSRLLDRLSLNVTIA